LSSGDSRDTPGAGFDENNQQSGSNNQGLIPQIVMNPWGSEAPMMTFAVQAYQHQWLLQVGLIFLHLKWIIIPHHLVLVFLWISFKKD
jgi:hypothetical protein